MHSAKEEKKQKVQLKMKKQLWYEETQQRHKESDKRRKWEIMKQQRKGTKTHSSIISTKLGPCEQQRRRVW